MEADSTDPAAGLVRIALDLKSEVDGLRFSAPVRHVYNPLDYAWEPHRAYLERFGGGGKEVLLVGMNPGPWGMVQTGVPFGEVELVRDWLGIHGEVRRPAEEHPRRPVEGFRCRRREVSGQRLWGWARQRFGNPDAFFTTFFVHNYCPLAFLEASGRNRTPDHLPAAEREPLFTACDRALERVVEALDPRVVVGVGVFAGARAAAVLGDGGPEVAHILHPSPASPAANRGWAEQATRQLEDLGVRIPAPDPSHPEGDA